MQQSVTELTDGSVIVRVRSRRGTDTRDQDEVTVEAAFDDLAEAEDRSDRVTELVRARMDEARSVGDPGVQEDEAAETDTQEVSKVYLGEGSELSGWIPLPREVVFEEIAPRVSRNLVGEGDPPGIMVNFSKDIPKSGWQEVDAQVVETEIEPLVREHRLDRE